MAATWVNVAFIKATVTPVCTRPLSLYTVEKRNLMENMEAVATRLLDVLLKKVPELDAIPLVQAFLACNPAVGFEQLVQMRADGLLLLEYESEECKSVRGESPVTCAESKCTHKESSAWLCRQFFAAFLNAMSGPGGTGREVREHFMAGGGVALSLQELRTPEFLAQLDKSQADSLVADVAGMLIAMIFNVSNVPELLSQLATLLRANNFFDTLEKYAASKSVPFIFLF